MDDIDTLEKQIAEEVRKRKHLDQQVEINKEQLEHLQEERKRVKRELLKAELSQLRQQNYEKELLLNDLEKQQNSVQNEIQEFVSKIPVST